jgi:hypothetical protein
MLREIHSADFIEQCGNTPSLNTPVWQNGDSANDFLSMKKVGKHGIFLTPHRTV